MKLSGYGAALLVALTPMTLMANPFAKSEVQVRYDDLDLQTVGGQERLDIRLTNAAEAVCGSRVDTIHVMTGRQARDCMASVKADALRQIAALDQVANKRFAAIN